MFEDISNWVTVVSWIVTLFEVIGAVIIFYASARVVVELVRPALRRHPPQLYSHPSGLYLENCSSLGAFCRE